MRQLRFSLGLGLVLGCLALPAGAMEARLFGEPLRLDLTESLYLNAHLDPGNGDPSSAYYGEVISKLNVQAAWRAWLLSTRLDSSGYVSAPELGDRLGRANARDQVRTVSSNDLRNRFQQHPWDPVRGVEKLSVSYQGRAVEATLGDFYANLGRGLVLSVRKVDELGIDTTIMGGKVTVRQGLFTGVALAGVTNTQNLDEATARYTPDALDRIGALRAQVRLFDKVSLGVHGMLGQPAKSTSVLATTPDRVGRVGLTLDAPRPTDWLALYGEYAHREDRVTDQTAAGNAFYAAATAFAGKTTWLLEAKSYDNYDVWHASNDPFASVVYLQPPTLERVTTQLSNNSDVTAARLRTDVTVGPGTVLFASAEYGRTVPSVVQKDALYDAYAGAQLRWNDGKSHGFPLVGYREEHAKDGSLVERLVAFEGDVAQPLSDEWSLEAQGTVWLRHKEGIDDWREGQAYLALKNAPRFVFVAGYEFTTLTKEQLNQHHFLNGTAQWNITSSTSLRLFAGGQRPGLKCVSGLCRVFPAFNGVKLELVVRG